MSVGLWPFVACRHTLHQPTFNSSTHLNSQIKPLSVIGFSTNDIHNDRTFIHRDGWWHAPPITYSAGLRITRVSWKVIHHVMRYIVYTSGYPVVRKLLYESSWKFQSIFQVALVYIFCKICARCFCHLSVCVNLFNFVSYSFIARYYECFIHI